MTATGIETTKIRGETTDVIMTGIVMTVGPIERRIERAKGNLEEGMKGATILQNELSPGIRTSVAWILRGTVNPNVQKRHTLTFISRFKQSLRNVCYFLLSSEGHSVCDNR